MQFSLKRLMLAVACFAITCATWATAYGEWRKELGPPAMGIIIACFGLIGLGTLGVALGVLLGSGTRGFLLAMIVAIAMAFAIPY
jgi:hypothetical protein